MWTWRPLPLAVRAPASSPSRRARVDSRLFVARGWLAGQPDGSNYLGTVVIRRELTPELARVGGHIGYHVVPSYRRRGHAGRMLAEALVFCAHFGLHRVLLTCEPINVASRKVIEANGGQYDGIADGELRYWIHTPAGPLTRSER